MIDAIRIFVRVVDSGSFSSAAEQLGRNPSSLTRRLDQLERELGATLLVRSTRRLELTPDGEQLYSQALGILSSLEDLKRGVGRQTVSGHLAISAFDTYGRETLVPLLPKFRQRYPDVQVALALDNRLVDLYRSAFDIGIRYGRPNDSSLHYRPIKKTTAVLIASPSYLSTRDIPESPGDLGRHECLTFYRPRQYTYWYFKKGEQRQKIRINAGLSSEGGTPLVLWCRAGEGIALLNRHFVEQDIGQGRLIELLPDWTASLTEQDSNQIYMVWTAAAAGRTAVRAFIDFMVEHAADS